MMHETGAIISGATALHFLLRQPCNWTPGDIDIIVPIGHFAQVVTFILNLPGAVIMCDIGTPDKEEYDMLMDIGFTWCWSQKVN